MEVKIYTDGAARGNPEGPGGYGAVLTYVDGSGKLYKKEISAGYKKTTNNRMELTAVIEALKKLKEPCEVTLTTDSKYVLFYHRFGGLASTFLRRKLRCPHGAYHFIFYRKDFKQPSVGRRRKHLAVIRNFINEGD